MENNNRLASTLGALFLATDQANRAFQAIPDKEKHYGLL